MTVFNVLKSGAVVLGLATGSAALAAGINGIGSMLGGDAWKATAARGGALGDVGRAVHVAEGGTVGRPDVTLFAPGESPSGDASGGSTGSVVLPALMAGSGTFNFSFAESEGPVAAPFAVSATPGAYAAAPAARGASAASESGNAVPGMAVASFVRGLRSGSGAVSSAAATEPGDEDEPLVTPFGADDPIVAADIVPVPLPAGGALMLSALLGLGRLRRAYRG